VKFVILLALVLSLDLGVYAQSDLDVVWEVHYAQNEDYNARGLVAGGADEFFLAGDILGVDLLVMKFDGQGQVVWERKFEGEGIAYAYDIIETGDGGVVVLGNTETEQLSGGAVYIFCLNPDGNMVWETIVPWRRGEIHLAWSIAGNKSSGYVVAGVTSGSSRIPFVLRFDGEGNELWRKTYPLDPGMIGPINIYWTVNEGYLIVWDSCVIKLSENGEKIWRKCLSTEPNLRDALMFNNTFIVAGYKNGDIYISSLDTEGNEIWEVTHGTEKSDSFYRMIRTNDNGLVLLSTTGQKEKDLLLTKLDYKGSKIWQRKVDGGENEFAGGIVEVSDKCIIAVGSSTSSDEKGAGLYLVKTCPIPTLSKPASCFIFIIIIGYVYISGKISNGSIHSHTK